MEDENIDIMLMYGYMSKNLSGILVFIGVILELGLIFIEEILINIIWICKVFFFIELLNDLVFYKLKNDWLKIVVCIVSVMLILSSFIIIGVIFK